MREPEGISQTLRFPDNEKPRLRRKCRGNRGGKPGGLLDRELRDRRVAEPLVIDLRVGAVLIDLAETIVDLGEQFRVALADSFIALDYMFGKMQWMLDGLQTYPAKMEHNLWRTKGLIFSSKVLLALVDTGISREDAYVIVQRNAMKVWEDIQNAVDGPTYRERLEADPEANLSKEVLDEIFDPWDFLTRKDVVFERLEGLEF